MASAAQDLRRSRADNRKRVLLIGTLVTADGDRQVRIHDISPTGALVSTDGRMKADSEVFLKKSPIWAAAWVAWTEDKSAGLKFYRQLSDSEVDSIFHRD